jgi:acyl-CoA synthetase (AMP-forming)/AMP-acid ligase II
MTAVAPRGLNEVRTMVDLLQFRRRTTGSKVFLEMLGEEITFEVLAEAVDRYAANFRERGVRQGDRVVILLPTCKEFLFAYFGAQRLGAIPVPLYPNSPLPRIGKIIVDCRARAVFGIKSMFGGAEEQIRALSPGTAVIDVAEIQELPVDPASFPAIGPDDLAFLQYTSGSTGEPKGVQLTHGNLLANIRAIIERMQHHPDETGVTWLPLYHDMGLIGFIFCPLYSASKAVVLAPDMRNPILWLQAISKHRAQFTGAPDFAYRLCNLMPDTGGIDLSSLRVAYSGGEPVRASTVRAFQEKFGLGDVVAPSYGLAESSLCVATAYPGTRVAEDARGFVSVGRPIAGTTVRIVQNGVPQPPAAVGEIEVHAPSNTTGYWGRPDDETLFAADGFLKTGDLGYLDEEGNLFIVGRSKNLIIRGGENIAPRELEEAADGVPEIRYSAAIGCEIEQYGGSEQILVFAEARDMTLKPSDYAQIVLKIRQAIKDRIGFFPNQVYLVKPRVIPRTANGKIQHVALREAFLRGKIAKDDAVLYPVPTGPGGASDPGAPPA